jgi:outer membrane scaffolding protein for murein synthesis (MipA/OmpV family)
MRRSLPFVLSAALAGFAAQAQAADLAADAPLEAVAAPVDIWVATIKGTGFYQPRFEGSKEYHFTGAPGLSIRRGNEPYKIGSPDDGIDIALINTPSIQFGPTARIHGERDSSKVSRFRGMDDIDYGIEPGAFLEYYPTEFVRLRGEARYGLWGSNGFSGTVAADGIFIYDKLTVLVGPRLELGDRKYMNTYFGVSAGEAADDGVSRYKAGGGIKSVGAAASATYQLTNEWSVTAFGRYDRYVDEAGKSPVTRTLGTKDAFTAGLGVGYSFAWNGFKF